ncbi:SLC13 family permease [Crossiella cryophila]|uniref:Anion transporter n=1 Tax=Crossiella cryophila TaxID=43355 RepID=A0A7W7C853_9PSEU|nr:SLC13 family permease [Crossiella cryophila]MBB4675033.1 anion transporter [Crossiella cryophila]
MSGTLELAPPWQRVPLAEAPTAPLRRRRRWWPLLVAVLALGGLAGALHFGGTGLTLSGQATLLVFTAAVAAWTLTRIDDTYVALAAALVLVLLGVLSGDQLFATLGGETIWLLIAAFVLAAGVGASGLPTRVAVALIGRARSVRGLAHLVTAALLLSAFAIPATSGRAALAVPVFVALAGTLRERPRVVRALAILFPTVILLSAVATLMGAGAHLVTSQLLTAATGSGIGFGQWLLLGLPLALVSSHLAAELVLFLFTGRRDRRGGFTLDLNEIRPPKGLSRPERRAALLLAGVSVAWASEPLHGVSPAVVALIGALLISSPRFGTVQLNKALAGVPWSLLVFMAATAALGAALISSGAAAWLATALLGPVHSPVIFLVVVVLVSTAAHLLIQSRSARSSVLVPLVIPAAIALGLNPVAVAFASTAAAGFCHTLSSSAKPVAMFAHLDGTPTYGRADLLRLSLFLGPLTAGLVLFFALSVWPLLGLNWR